MNRILRSALSRLVRSGDLTIIDSHGQRHRMGDGSGRPVVVRIVDSATEARLLKNPELALGEAYMDGLLVVEEGSLYDFMNLLLGQDPVKVLPLLIGAQRAMRFVTRRLNQWNVTGRAKQNVAHHYDLDARLYDLFLDRDRQYSCAYFEDPNATIDEAQLAKKRHLTSKLDLRPGQRVLDVGCGWGGLALYMAEHYSADVTGITLSEEQLSLARRRAEDSGFKDRVHFDLVDYRDVPGTFDRVISVGMFEHVGVNYYRTYFEKIRDMLSDDGVAVVHTIGRTSPPGSTNPWIAKYIFPGGYIPALSEVMDAIEPTGLIVSDIEILRLHYAETLRQWRHRFVENWDRAREIYDERFCRMWEFYLVGSELSFRNDGMVNFQIQLTKRIDALPMTRNYMTQSEDALRLKDEERQRPALQSQAAE